MSLLDSLLESELANAVVVESALAKEVFIAIRRDGQAGAGTKANPYNGATAAAFDAVMNGLGPGMVARLGPGVFPTDRVTQWLPQSGQKIVGSGMFATTIQLALSAPVSGQPYHVFDLNFLSAISGFELSDLTIDCNLAGQPNTGSDGYPRIAVGGINLHGSDILIRRVRVINFGTNTPMWEYGQSTPPTSWECFPLSVAFARPGDNLAPKNCVVEDCIVEQPALNNARETTCMNLSAGEDDDLRPAYHADCVIRNCYINCEYVRATATKPALRVKALSCIGNLAILETYDRHNRVQNDWIVVSGATDPAGGTYQQLGPSALFNGSFKVLSAADYALTYLMDSAPASAVAGGEICLGKAPSAMVTVEAIEKKQVGSVWWVILTTASPHYQIPGDYALIQSVRINPGGESSENNRYNGYYKLEAVTAQDVANPKPSRMFKYQVGAQDPGTLSSDAYNVAMVGANFQGVSADGGRRALVERNRIFHCRIGGPFHDTYNTKSLIVRKNYYHNVYCGIYQNLGTSDESALAPIWAMSGAVTVSGARYRFTRNDGSQMPYQMGHVVVLSGQNFSRYVMVQSVNATPAYFEFDAPGFDPTVASSAVRIPGAIGGTIALVSGTNTRYEFTRSGVTNLMPYEVGEVLRLPAGASDQHVQVLSRGENSATFQFEASAAPTTPACAIRIFQVEQLLVEDNVMELALYPVGRKDHAPICGINVTSRKPISDPWTFQSVIVRGNFVRHLGGMADPANLGDSRGIDVSSCRSLIVESNVIGVEGANWALRHYQCGTVKALNNQDFAGKPVYALKWDVNPNEHTPEIRTQAEELFLKQWR